MLCLNCGEARPPRGELLLHFANSLLQSKHLLNIFFVLIQCSHAVSSEFIATTVVSNIMIATLAKS